MGTYFLCKTFIWYGSKHLEEKRKSLFPFGGEALPSLLATADIVWTSWCNGVSSSNQRFAGLGHSHEEDGRWEKVLDRPQAKLQS